MSSNINYSSINVNYPVAGTENNPQGFRDNFASIKDGLEVMNSEISGIQALVADISDGNYAVDKIGATGARGVTGSTGISGYTGSVGTTGGNGATGPVGSNGATGLTGRSGATGSTGVNGPTGNTGNDGSTGLSGLTGSTGLIGASGLKGSTGAVGIAGNTGNTGVIGNTGTQGIVGQIGSTGANGNTGVTGSGVIGNTGVSGNTGSQGATGLVGATGMSVNILGSVATSADLSTFDPTPSKGDGILTLDTGHLWVWDNAWSDSGNISGPVGTHGATGATGLAGSTGATGSTGPQGSIGVSGAVGTNGSSGPQGATGANGVTGPQGSTGPTGVSGNNGLTGNYGSTGVKGQDGAPGSDGVDGVTGPDGSAGTNGLNGATGVTGDVGTAGEDAISAPQGDDGTQGEIGIDGNPGSPGADGNSGSSGTDGNIGATGVIGIDGAQGPQGTPTDQPLSTFDSVTFASITVENQSTLQGNISTARGTDGWMMYTSSSTLEYDIKTILVDNSGNVYYGGYESISGNEGIDSKTFVYKVSPTGSILWNIILNDGNFIGVSVNKLLLEPSTGNILVLCQAATDDPNYGYAYNQNIYFGLIFRLNPSDGSLITTNGIALHTNDVTGLTYFKDGVINSSGTIITISDNNTVWLTDDQYISYNSMFTKSVAIDSVGNIYTGGYNHLAKLNSSCVLQWSISAVGAVSFSTQMSNIVIDSNDYIYANTNYTDSGQPRVGITKLDTSGQIVWEKYISGSTSTYFQGILAMTPSDDIIFCASSIDPRLGRPGILVSKITPAGGVLWQYLITNENLSLAMFNEKHNITCDDNYFYISVYDEGNNTYISGFKPTYQFKLPLSGAMQQTSLFSDAWNIIKTNYTFVGTGVTSTTTASTGTIKYWGFDRRSLLDWNANLNSNTDSISVSTQTVDNTLEGFTPNVVTINNNQLLFEDLSVQTTAATFNIPQSRHITSQLTPIVGPGTIGLSGTGIPTSTSITLNLYDSGKHIYINGLDNDLTINVPDFSEIPFPEGTVITLIVYKPVGTTYNVIVSSSITTQVFIDDDSSQSNAWNIGSALNAGWYTLMNVYKNTWVLSGPDIAVYP